MLVSLVVNVAMLGTTDLPTAGQDEIAAMGLAIRAAVLAAATIGPLLTDVNTRRSLSRRKANDARLALATAALPSALAARRSST